MNTKILLLLAMVAVAAADKRPIHHNDHDSHDDRDNHGDYHHHYNSYEHGHPKYEFEYKVKDKYYNDFGHQESRDGDKTQGSYYVQLPDGRLQTVTYYVDGYSGYVADVNYEGEAHYDSHEYGKYDHTPKYSPSYE